MPSSINRQSNNLSVCAKLLDQDTVAVAALLSEAAAAGVSNDRLSRAARRIGVSRRKLGMDGGWVWALPEDCAPASAAT